MRRKALAILFVGLCMVVSIYGGQKAEGKPIVLRWGHVVTEDTPLHISALRMAEIVEQRSNGQIKIEIYPNSQLGTNPQMVEALQVGALDMHMPAWAVMYGFTTTEKTKLLDLPYLFKNEKAAEAVIDGEIGEELRKSFEEVGIIGLGCWTQGWRHVTANKEIRKPEDFKGLKIRTMESELHMDHFKTLGASPVPMAFSEVFTSLQQGVIDAQENPYTNIYTMGFYRVQKYINQTAHLYDPTAILMAKSTWDRLSDEQKKIIKEAEREARVYERELTRKNDTEVKEKLKDYGNIIIELTPEERTALREAVQPMYDKWTPRIGKELLQKVVEAQKDF
ncbi:TRAP transporter substrate-binding protein [Acetomicrobium sp. S15 = DSM 107314]|uniref:TRAP transporter substrate-binding protein n=1 Tax=Acetomicrobium sp. S15 = DSM 107314 TaxID=2529858 RepID=UPI0018E0F397|nr:TRAP transporter substrate-binding protein [Acetomicrobium sp. S15 = DSM 107314]